MHVSSLLWVAAIATAFAFTGCGDDSSPSTGAAGSPSAAAGLAGDSATDESIGGAAVAGGGAPAAAGGVGDALGGATLEAAAGAGSETDGGQAGSGNHETDPPTLEEYNALVCTQRFAFAAEARQQVAPLVSSFNQCTTAADCAPLEGVQLGCPDSNWFWLGMYTIRSDSEQAFRAAIAEVAAEICDTPPEPIVSCTMGSITLPHTIMCSDGHCYANTPG